MLLIGLTGGIASGKSSVLRYMSERGITLIDADLIARQVVEPNQPAWHAIKHEFGSSIVTRDGHLDRDELGDMIFRDREKRLLLNSITHPYIHRKIFTELIIALINLRPFVVLDLPLLYEIGRFTGYFYKIVVINCTEAEQIQRLRLRNNLSEEKARLRIASQMPLSEKCRRADIVIDNSGTLEETYKQVDIFLDQLNNTRAFWKYRLLFLFILFNIILIVFVFIRRLLTFSASFS